MTAITIVPLLRVIGASGPTLYPDEGGFSSVWGEVECDDQLLIRSLNLSAKLRAEVTLRCGLLEVSGVLDKRELLGTISRYRIRISSVCYGPPGNQAPNKALERSREG